MLNIKVQSTITLQEGEGAMYLATLATLWVIKAGGKGHRKSPVHRTLWQEYLINVNMKGLETLNSQRRQI